MNAGIRKMSFDSSGHVSPRSSVPGSSPSAPTNRTSSENNNIRTLPQRWMMLMIFALLTATNAILWISFAPIQSSAITFYDSSSTGINMLSTAFLALYLPGSLLASTLMSTHGLRYCLVLGSVMNGIAGWLRYVSALSWVHDSSVFPSWAPYGILLLGQCTAAIVQPMFTNAPSMISAEWFATNERDIATTIAALVNLIGNAAGQVIPPIVVSGDFGNGTGSGMDVLLLSEAILASLGFLLTFFLYRDRPADVFPSRIALMKHRAREAEQRLREVEHMEQEEVDGMTGALSRWGAASMGVGQVVKTWMQLLKDTEFIKLMLGFGAGLAIFNTLMTVISQMIRPAGYTDDDAGTFGGVLIGAGLVGAMIVGPVLDCTKMYKVFLKVGMPIALAATIGFVVALKPDNMLWLIVGIGCLGFVMLPMMPVSLETAAECTYPIPEDCSSALLMITGQLMGIPLIFLLEYFIELRPKYDGCVWTPAGIFLVCSISVCVIFVWWFNGDMKRLQAERERSFSGSAGDEYDELEKMFAGCNNLNEPLVYEQIVQSYRRHSNVGGRSQSGSPQPPSGQSDVNGELNSATSTSVGQSVGSLPQILETRGPD